MAETRDEAAIRSVVLDYVEGWFDGDAARMERALHPDLSGLTTSAAESRVWSACVIGTSISSR